ncbi:uncharacterized protein DS421_15g524190 [Arachis hypogaea]|nr:uncharacterized protein DS421_15g524190 [Arachis hypogaea]
MSSKRPELLAMATKLFELGGAGETPPLLAWPETELPREIFSSFQKRSCS